MKEKDKHTPNIFQVIPKALGLNVLLQFFFSLIRPLLSFSLSLSLSHCSTRTRALALAWGQSRAATGFSRSHGDQRYGAAMATRHHLLERSVAQLCLPALLHRRWLRSITPPQIIQPSESQAAPKVRVCRISSSCQNVKSDSLTLDASVRCTDGVSQRLDDQTDERFGRGEASNTRQRAQMC